VIVEFVGAVLWWVGRHGRVVGLCRVGIGRAAAVVGASEDIAARNVRCRVGTGDGDWSAVGEDAGVDRTVSKIDSPCSPGTPCMSDAGFG